MEFLYANNFFFSVSQQLSGLGQSVQFLSGEKKLVWTVKKMFGKTEVSAHLTVRHNARAPSENNDFSIQ